MSTDLQAPTSTTEFQTILANLKLLVRDHLLYFRLEVGRVILDSFFGGDSFAYTDRSNAKQTKFTEFLDTHAEDLASFGLKPWLLRESVQVHIVHQTLPPTVPEQLGYTRMLELVRVSDPTKRAQLANAAITQSMTVAQFKDTVGAANSGTWYDTDDATPGVQPKAPVQAALPPPQPGRLITQAEKWLNDAQTLAAGWAAVDPTKVKAGQRDRMKKAVAALRTELEALEKKLTA